MDPPKVSAGLKLIDLDDYIAPSQECTIPLEGEIVSKSSSSGGRKIGYDDDNNSSNTVEAEDEDSSKSTKRAVKISLNDCLACSGCITSAESVLISSQSRDEFLNQTGVGRSKKKIIVILSTQFRASLAAHYKLNLLETTKKIVWLFKNEFNADYVVDAGFGRDISLMETAKEYELFDKEKKPSPYFVGACPGWICYAEKSHGDFILPHIGTTKSPQQITGTLLKHTICKEHSISPEDIYVVSIMPCFDKKLEATREDFVISSNSSASSKKAREVDCVLATNEVLDLIESKNIDFSQLKQDPLSSYFFNYNSERNECFGYQGASGGFAEYVYLYMAKKYGITVPENKPIFSPMTKSNIDLQIATLERSEDQGGPLIFAYAYGMRNIQNVIRKMKLAVKTKKPCPFNFVEIMACPWGCTNGGGQLRESIPEQHKLLHRKVTEIYSSQISGNPDDNSQVVELYRNLSPEFIKEHFHAKYLSREKKSNNTVTGLKW